MPRRRMIDPAIWDDPDVGELGPQEFRLFIGCISLADDEGRLDADPRFLRKVFFGFSKDVTVPVVLGWRNHMIQCIPDMQLQTMVGRERIVFTEREKIHGVRPIAREWQLLRMAVFERDHYTCQYCGRTGGKLECDHVVPVSRGGSNDLVNLATACFCCNRAKHDKTAKEWIG